MHSFEIEIKSLLGEKNKADELIEKMKTLDTDFQSFGSHIQLNHYFVGGDLKKLKDKILSYIPESKQAEFIKLTDKAKDYSMRSRQADTKVIFVLKVAIDDTTSSNGTARLEFESELNMSLDELDKIILSADFQYQAKWSRERQAFKYKNYDVTIDKNAGYGYLAEFESVITDHENVETIKKQIRETMAELGVEELNQDRLARMFNYYNTHWQEYYGTDKTFIIE